MCDLDKRLEPFVAKRGGVFVEAGANDGLRQSNTLYFEKYLNWSGLLVEPVPRLYQLCRANRPKCVVEHAALVSSTYESEFATVYDCGLMSVMEGAFGDEEKRESHLKRGASLQTELPPPNRIDVPALPLSGVLDKHRVDRVDFLSLDVEGYELNALEGVDFSRHRPRVILVESRGDGAVNDLLVDAGYRKEAVLAITETYEDVLYRDDASGSCR